MSTQRRYEGTRLEEVLERVQAQEGVGARIVRVDRIRTGGIAGFFQREGYEVIVESNGPPAAAPAGKAAPAARSVVDIADDVSDLEEAANVSTEHASFEDAMRDVTRVLDDDPEVGEAWRGGVTAYREVGDDSPGHDGAGPDSGLDEDRAVASAPMTLAPRGRMAPTGTSLLAEIDDSMLGRLGLPAGLVPPADTARRDLRRALVDRFQGLPSAPPVPHDPGTVIAVLGDTMAALALARRLADELKLERDDVLLAADSDGSRCVPAWLQLSDPQQVTSRRRSWWRRAHPVLVAVDAPASAALDGWPAAMIDALEPTLVLGVVDARRKPEDIEEWSKSVGGVDALALEHTADTVSPAAVLRLPIPVARLEGKIATPERWAGLLVRQLAA